MAHACSVCHGQDRKQPPAAWWEPSAKRRRHGSHPWPGKAPRATGRTPSRKPQLPTAPAPHQKAPAVRRPHAATRGLPARTPGAKLRGSKDRTMSGQQNRENNAEQHLIKKTAKQQPGPNQPHLLTATLCPSARAQALAGQSAAPPLVAVPASSARQWEADRLRGSSGNASLLLIKACQAECAQNGSIAPGGWG